MGMIWPSAYNSVGTVYPSVVGLPGVSNPAVSVSRPIQGMVQPWRQAPLLSQSGISPAGFPLHLVTLPNGHRILIENRPTDIISVRTFVNAGSINEDPIHPNPLYRKTGFPAGIAHLDEHCHFLATRNFPAKNSWMETMVNTGARINASTSPEVIQHEVCCNVEDLPSILSMHAESVLRPVYRADQIAQEKTNVINELRMRTSSPEAKVMSKVSELLFERPEFQTIGTETDVISTTPEQLQCFHHTFYTPTNMLTVISGRVNPAMITQVLNREFGNNPVRLSPHPQAATRIALRPGEIRHATITDPQLNYSLIHLAMPAPDKANIKERITMEFIADLLGGNAMSMLDTQVKDQQGLASDLNVSYSPRKAAGSLEVILHTDPGLEQKTLQATLNAIGQLSTWAVTPEKLAEVRGRCIQRFKHSLNNVEQATHLMGEEALHNSLAYVTHYQQVASAITAEDIMGTARKYLNPSTYAVVFGVPPRAAQKGGR